MADLGGLDLDAALVDHLGRADRAPPHPALWARARPSRRTTAQRRDRPQFWDDVRGAKEMLSRAAVAPVAGARRGAAVQLTREELERLATPLLRRGVHGDRDGDRAAAGLRPDQLAGLFLVGGSSRVPLVARLLHAELGIAPTVLEQPELPVAEGALTDLPLPRPGRRPGRPYAAAPLRRTRRRRCATDPPGRRTTGHRTCAGRMGARVRRPVRHPAGHRGWRDAGGPARHRQPRPAVPGAVTPGAAGVATGRATCRAADRGPGRRPGAPGRRPADARAPGSAGAPLAGAGAGLVDRLGAVLALVGVATAATL